MKLEMYLPPPNEQNDMKTFHTKTLQEKLKGKFFIVKFRNWTITEGRSKSKVTNNVNYLFCTSFILLWRSLKFI